MSTDQTVVHELLISEEAFAIIAEAIRVLSIETLKFQKLRDVVTHCLERLPTFTDDAASLYEEHLPFDGSGGPPNGIRMSLPAGPLIFIRMEQ